MSNEKNSAVYGVKLFETILAHNQSLRQKVTTLEKPQTDLHQELLSENDPKL